MLKFRSLALALTLGATCARGADGLSNSSPTNGLKATMNVRQEAISRRMLTWVDRFDRLLANSISTNKVERGPDSFYTDSELRDIAEGSYVEVTPELKISEDGVGFDVGFSSRLRLRRASARLRLFVESFDDREDAVDDVVGPRPFTDRDSDSRASVGLGYVLADRLNFKADASAGLAFRPAPAPRFKIRARIERNLGAWRARVTETGFWEADDGFGERTQIEFRRKVFERDTINLGSSAIWSETSQGVDLGQLFAYIHPISSRNAIAFKFGVASHTAPSAIVDRYVVRLPFRRLVHADWMYIEVEPGVNFDNESDFDAAPQIILRLDLLFGDVPTP